MSLKRKIDSQKRVVARKVCSIYDRAHPFNTCSVEDVFLTLCYRVALVKAKRDEAKERKHSKKYESLNLHCQLSAETSEEMKEKSNLKTDSGIVV